MRTILYEVKSTSTSATTNYMAINKEDMDFLMSRIISMQSYFNELMLCKDKDVRDLLKWYKSPTKSLPYNSKFRSYNSPMSFIAGTLNNIMYGNQQDLTELQANHLQNILNNYSAFTEALSEININLQKNHNQETLFFTENVWVTL